jgi:hypothetical protein
LDTWRALALPNCITRLPPPCIELMTNRNRPNSTIIGRRLNSREVQMESSCWSTSRSMGGSASPISRTSSSAYSCGNVTLYSLPSSSSPVTSWERSLMVAVFTSSSATRSWNCVSVSSSGFSSLLRNCDAKKSAIAPMRM